jgi:glutathione S-transferase
MRTLFHYPLCPFSRKVRFVLGEKKLDFTLQNEPIWKKQEEFLDLNPAGQVPVFIDSLNDETFCLSESQAILEYLEESYPETSLRPDSIKGRAEMRRLCHYIDGKFYTDVIHKVVYEKTLKRLMGEGGPDSRHLRDGTQALLPFLDYFSWLLEKRHWLAGDTLTLADFTLAAHLSCLDYMGNVPWEKYPEVKEWYVRLKSRPSFKPLLADTVAGIVLSSNYRDLDF